MAKDLTQEEMDKLLTGIQTAEKQYVDVKTVSLSSFCMERNETNPRIFKSQFGGYCYRIGTDYVKISQLIPIEIIESAKKSSIIPPNVSIKYTVDTLGCRVLYEAWIEPDVLNWQKIMPNDYLKEPVIAAYHTFYRPYNRSEDGPTSYINILKNYPDKHSDEELVKASNTLKDVLDRNLSAIKEKLGVSLLTIVLVPRSKPWQEEWFQWLRRAVSEWVDAHKEEGYINGCEYIIRQKDSPMTHWGETGIYPGITKDTCTLSSEIEGKDILLIDDIYTYGVNVDEDALQAVRDNKPKSITFYSVAKTLKKID